MPPRPLRESVAFFGHHRNRPGLRATSRRFPLEVKSSLRLPGTVTIHELIIQDTSSISIVNNLTAAIALLSFDRERGGA
jgi:hypothetical protein